MSRSYYFYLRLSVRELEKVVEDYKTEFDTLLEDTFTDEELLKYEKLIDAIAAVYVQPLSDELSFDDLYPTPQEEEKQRLFFESAKSCLCLDNLPYLEENPFQVTYILDLLWSFEEVLIDRGGIQELTFRKNFLEELKKYRTMDVLIEGPRERVLEVKTSVPVTPIDFLVQDIYRELERIKNQDLDTMSLYEKAQRIYLSMKDEKLTSEEIFKKSGLIPKDFDDSLEKLKFWLRKIP